MKTSGHLSFSLWGFLFALVGFSCLPLMLWERCLEYVFSNTVALQHDDRQYPGKAEDIETDWGWHQRPSLGKWLALPAVQSRVCIGDTWLFRWNLIGLWKTAKKICRSYNDATFPCHPGQNQKEIGDCMWFSEFVSSHLDKTRTLSIPSLWICKLSLQMSDFFYCKMLNFHSF